MKIDLIELHELLVTDPEPEVLRFVSQEENVADEVVRVLTNHGT